MVSKRNSLDRYANERLSSIRRQALYRQLQTVIVGGATCRVNGREAIHLCSNDYLGLSRNKRIAKKTIESLEEISQCSSRLIAGNHPRLIELEDMLADHRRTEAALVYPSGYSANIGVVTSIAGRGSTIFSDELNHASIIDACRLSGAKIKVFKHNDTAHLEELMRSTQGRKIVITEGIFSMDGDTSSLKAICSIAREHDAVSIVDDAHGDFIFGPRFSGVPSMLRSHVDAHVSSLSKGLGCFGGYVAASSKVRELLVNTSRQFIYTSALPAHLCVAAITAIPLAKKGDLQKKLQKNIIHLREGLERLGFLLGNSSSQIIPVIIGREKLAVEISKELLIEGVFVQAVRFPTVARGQSRLRVSLTALHTSSHLDAALEAFERVGKRAKII